MSVCQTIVERAGLRPYPIPCAIIEHLCGTHSATLMQLISFIDDKLANGVFTISYPELFDLFSVPTLKTFIIEKNALSAIDFTNEKLKRIDNQNQNDPIIVAHIHKVTIEFESIYMDRYVLVRNI